MESRPAAHKGMVSQTRSWLQFWVWFLELLHTGSISLTGAASLRIMRAARWQASFAKLAKLLEKKGNPAWISSGLLLLKVSVKEAWSTTCPGVHNQGWGDIKEANYYLAPLPPMDGLRSRPQVTSLRSMVPSPLLPRLCYVLQVSILCGKSQSCRQAPSLAVKFESEFVNLSKLAILTEFIRGDMHVPGWMKWGNRKWGQFRLPDWISWCKEVHSTVIICVMCKWLKHC